jgi:hypothetical protein
MGLTFPDNEDFIAEEVEFFEIAFVAEDVAAAFILPEFGPCSGYNSAVSAAVHMPKTAVNKDYFFMSYKHNIRMTGKIAAMKSVTITQAMNDRTNDYFRRSVFSVFQENTCTQGLTNRKCYLNKNTETD